jgi:hypothetical protein
VLQEFTLRVIHSGQAEIRAGRRFPPPWSIEDIADGSGQKLAYIYYEEQPGRRSAAKVLTKDEARRIAANFAKLPGLLRQDWCPASESAPPCLLWINAPNSFLIYQKLFYRRSTMGQAIGQESRH